MAPKSAQSKEKIEFKAEVAQVLNLVVNSLYSRAEVFLRELISNASDAIDKHRHLTMTDEKFEKPLQPYAIKITPDKKAKTLTISDNGIGMSKEEVIQNLGTIASSGTRVFAELLKEKQQAGEQFIGQFGVGFYSAFMVADKVVVETKRAAETGPAVRWESDAKGGYTLEEIEKPVFGTEIVLHMKKESEQYLDEWEIKSVVKKYSDYVSHPIFIKNEKGEEEQINKVTAIWRRSKSEIKEEEYSEFYKYISHDSEDPLLYCHHSIEGKLEYKLLLFVPKKAPVNFFRDDIRGLRLHVKKMFVTDECKDLLPIYLRFIKGVVDSEDLPLNISRETLQHNAIIPVIRKQLTKRIFDLLEELAKSDPQKYREFFLELGVALKEGITGDFENRERILDLLRYPSSQGQSAADLISLNDYVMRMKEGQKEIYYLTGPNFEACHKSPHVEFFRNQGIEVLYMTDLVDEWAADSIAEYKKKPLKSVMRGDLDLGDLSKDVKKQAEESDSQFGELKDKIFSALQDHIKQVRLSIRLQESPCCLVVDEGDMNVQMEKIMKSMGQEFKPAKRILEINPNHPILQNMQAVLKKDPKSEHLQDWSFILYNQALLREGGQVQDPTEFIRKVNVLLEEVTKGS